MLCTLLQKSVNGTEAVNIVGWGGGPVLKHQYGYTVLLSSDWKKSKNKMLLYVFSILS